MLNAKGKKILKSSYSVLQDDFFNFMRNAGYTDVERGECGSTEEHLTVTPVSYTHLRTSWTETYPEHQ